MTNKRNNRNRASRGKRAIGDTTLMAGGGAVLGIVVLWFVIFPIAKGFLGLALGDKANLGLDKGFTDLVTKAEMLAAQPEQADQPSPSLTHIFTVDKNFFVLGFSIVDSDLGYATKPPECEGQACFCVCIGGESDNVCSESVDTKNNLGRDCRVLRDYNTIAVSGKVDNNDDSKHFYVKGRALIPVLGWISGNHWEAGVDKTVSITLTKKGKTLEISQGPA